MIGHIYCSAFGYADDLSIVAPSFHALKMMSKICLAYAKEYDLKCNPSKCQLVKYGNSHKAHNIPFYFDNVLVEYKDKAVHLGHTIGPKVHTEVIRDMSHDLTWRVNSVLAYFRFCNSNTKFELVMSYCTSFYGSCLLNLQDKSVDTFYVTWRKAIRRILGVPLKTLCKMLPLIANCLPIETQIISRMVKFVQGCIKSDKPSLKLLSDMALRGSGSHFSKSCNHIMASYNLTYCDFYKYSHHHLKSLFENQYLEELDL